MPDEDGNMLPGELMSGNYGAIEADLGHKLRPLAGFGREISDSEEEWEETLDFIFEPAGFGTKSNVRYTLKGWNG